MRKSLIVCLVAMVLAGCATDTATAEGETITDFFGVGASPAEEEALFRDNERQRQEFIQSCMAEAGFDYIPIQLPEDAFQIRTDDDGEFARTRGFGMVTDFDVPVSDWVDPNQETIDAMSAPERDSYYEALYGNPEGMATGVITDDPACYDRSYIEIYGDPRASSQIMEELEPELIALRDRVDADPRIVDLNQEWSACMAEEGFGYEDPDSMYQSVMQDIRGRYDALVDEAGGFDDPLEGWTRDEVDEFFANNTNEEIDAVLNAWQDELDSVAVEELREEEIAIAVANFECSTEYEETYSEVWVEYEAEFIDANRPLLEQMRDATGG